jgi:hypothetical protein
LVLFYEDMKNAPWQFLDQLAGFMGVSYPRDQLSLKPVHPSYSEGQLRVIRWLGRFILPDRELALPRKQPWKWLVRRSQMLRSYLVLYPVGLLPKRWLRGEPLIYPDHLERVREAYAADWEACRAYAVQNNPGLTQATHPAPSANSAYSLGEEP